MTSTQKWQPLEHIIYGFAIHPLSQSSFAPPQDNEGSLRDLPSNAHLSLDFIARLDVGDEVYAFEQYGDVNNVWYRGYVVSSTRSSFSQAQHDSSGQTTLLATLDEPQVFVAIFPRSHIHVRDELPDAEGTLAQVYARVKLGQDPYGREKYAMETLREEDEQDHTRGRHPRVANGATGTASAATAPLSPSIEKLGPPRPSIKSGDDTAAGQTQPLVDEIASALREWHSLLFVYLSKRDYKLFATVKEHLEALHFGRRQLLSETLSADETVKLRKACVTRLVRGNMVQGLDVIVRHPTWGGLVTVDVENSPDVRSWMSAVRMYAMQVSLAHVDDLGDSSLIPRSCALHGLKDHLTKSETPSREKSHAPTPSFASSKLSLSRLQHASSNRTQATPSASATNPRASVSFYHVFLELRAFVATPCAPGETAELYFSLYSKTSGRFLTEEFCAILNHNGVLARDSLAKVRTLFTDLGHQDLQDTIYLVCQIVRSGGMKMSAAGSGFSSVRSGSVDVRMAPDEMDAIFIGGSSSSGRENPNFLRRPFGCAVMELQQLTKVAAGLEIGLTREYSMSIFVPTNEASFSTLHQDLIASNTSSFEKSPRADTIAVTVKVFHGEAQTTVRENPTLLQDVPITARLGFPDVVFPDDVRNEVYIKLWSGDFNPSSTGSSGSVRLRKGVAALAGSSNPANVEVSCEVRRQSGQVVEAAIALGTGEPPVTRFRSMVFHRNDTPTYGELIKLLIPANIMQECHLFFTFRNRSSKERPTTGGRADTSSSTERPFAFGYLPLFPERQSFLEDGTHTLILYKADKLSAIPINEYINAPAVVGQSDPHMMSRNLIPLRDSFTIRSFLCSTQFTANGVLVDLLNWERLQVKADLIAALKKFTFVGEMEIVKFLRDIFDSLFAILGSSHNQDGEMDDLVFNALVMILGIVQDRRFNNFQPVLDVYIEKHFNCASASYHMLHSMNRLLANPADQHTASPLRAAIKVWHYIFKFIIRARELQKQREVGINTTSEHLDANFKREIQAHLNEVNKLMSESSDPALVGTQTLALQHFSSILSELSDIFKPVELVSIVTSFATAIGHVKGKMIIWKLMTYLQFVRGFLFDNAQSRGLLLEVVVGWIKPHFGAYDEYMHLQLDDTEAVRDASRIQWLETTRICISIIAVMVDRLLYCFVDPVIAGNPRAWRQEQDNVEYLLSLLPRQGKENTARLLLSFFQVAISILNNEAFPDKWLNVNILCHRVMLKIFDPIAFILLRDFIPHQERSSGDGFNVRLWRDALSTLLKLLASDQLVIEEFSPQKRRAVWRLANDVRGEGAAILLRLWEAIGWSQAQSAQAGAVTRYGGYQTALVSLVEQVLNLCLSHHDQLRSNAVQILYSMIVSEYHQHGSFSQIETELINKLDKLFMSDIRGDDISRAFFVNQLRSLFDSSSLDDQLKERVGEFLDLVDLFLELLLTVRGLPEGEEYQDDRVIATLRLMNFIRRIGRDEMYIKYVHQLVNMHLQGHNYVEAALTLKLHADLHEWDLNSFVDPMPELDLPRQSQFVRKETLCLLILDYLGKGKAWESAVEICKELAFQHSEITFDYQRLSEILVHQAKLLEHIVTDQRYYSEYFRVAFYGNFPAATRDKHFIYRGYEWEKLGAFCERMLNKHPEARLLKSAGEPSDEIRSSPYQYIQCMSVTPEPDRTLSIFTNPDVPESVRKYYEHSAINLFSSKRQVFPNSQAGFCDTWVEKTFYTTEETFPTVLRRSEIVSVQVVETSPIENAIQDVEARTRELHMLELKYKTLAQTERVISTNPLTAALNNAVDSPDDSGVLLYRQAFLSPDYLTEHPDQVDAMHKLSVVIEDHVRVIRRCLALHGALCSPEMRTFHGVLDRFFQKNFAGEIDKLNMVDEPIDEAPSSPSRNPTGLYTPPPVGWEEVSPTSGAVSPQSPPFSVNGYQQFTPPENHRASLRPMMMRDPGAGEYPRRNQTPLQRNLAYLARHGLNPLSSSSTAGAERSTLASEPRSDSPDGVSNTGHFVNVGYPNGRDSLSTINGRRGTGGSLSRKLGSIVRRGSK
ncbi:hypothetical protein M407DRAFT_67006 [Tulasnella calospora MUT 4182]|uniref:DOCKER domain-containing protein n=1 Tax=Tulasnella calospora MUT 4182 TaxID=1051891 RepID=A0A0C3LE19_9AGAM|nr:hypothetical protein M407DRAFT_67006 [Tulasnella calospora MUT 4182]